MRIAIICGASYKLGWGRSQNLARELVIQGNDVFYINAITPIISKETLSKRETVNSKDGVQLYYQRGLPSVKFPVLSKLDSKLLSVQLNKIIKQIKSVDLILYYGIPAPWMVDLINSKLTHKLSAYDCADDKKAMFTDLISETHGQTVDWWENYLLSNTDFSVGMSESVCSILKSKSDKMVYRVENGVDLNLFTNSQRAIDENKPLKIVYTGAINDRLDFKRLKSLAQKSNVKIDLYGNNHPILDEISDTPNISYKGFVSYFDLPNILAKYDYGILPNRNLESIRNSSPLKVLQYLSSGLKIISFPFPVWPELTSYVQIIDGEKEPSLQPTLEPSEEELHSFSWSKRVETYTEILKKWGVS